jgi:hypothetical protein
MRGTLATKKFIGGDAWYKVLGFQQHGCAPGKFELYEARVKNCEAESSVVVYSGTAYEDGAWVVQEWAVDVAPTAPTPFAIGWINPARHREQQP